MNQIDKVIQEAEQLVHLAEVTKKAAGGDWNKWEAERGATAICLVSSAESFVTMLKELRK